MKRQLQDISNQNEFIDPKKDRRSPDVRRRRVEMEKRRRDKINYYLDELAQLVPAAAEKKGCAKLEKAEVLELTVDHVRSMVKEKKDVTSKFTDGIISAEKERKRGFLACLKHISQFLEKSECFVESNEELISGIRSFFNGQTVEEDDQCANEREQIYDRFISQQKEAALSPGSVTYENIFYKICMDFLKNTSPEPDTMDNASPAVKPEEDYSCWQAVPEVPSDLSLSCENFCSIDELSPPYGGSFMSFLNNYY